MRLSVSLRALFILGNTRCFFDENSQFFGLGLNQPGNHALLDNGIAAGTQAGAQEDIRDITTPALGAVEKIFGLPSRDTMRLMEISA